MPPGSESSTHPKTHIPLNGFQFCLRMLLDQWHKELDHERKQMRSPFPSGLPAPRLPGR